MIFKKIYSETAWQIASKSRKTCQRSRLKAVVNPNQFMCLIHVYKLSNYQALNFFLLECKSFYCYFFSTKYHLRPMPYNRAKEACTSGYVVKSWRIDPSSARRQPYCDWERKSNALIIRPKLRNQISKWPRRNMPECQAYGCTNQPRKCCQKKGFFSDSRPSHKAQGKEKNTEQAISDPCWLVTM